MSKYFRFQNYKLSIDGPCKFGLYYFYVKLCIIFLPSYFLLGVRASARKPIVFVRFFPSVSSSVSSSLHRLSTKTHTCKLHMILKLSTYLNPNV